MKIVTDQPSYVVHETYGIGRENWDSPDHLAIGQISMAHIFKTYALEPGGKAHDFPISKTPLNVEEMDFPDLLRPGRSLSGEQYLNRRLFNDALLVVHKGGD